MYSETRCNKCKRKDSGYCITCIHYTNYYDNYEEYTEDLPAT